MVDPYVRAAYGGSSTESPSKHLCQYRVVGRFLWSLWASSRRISPWGSSRHVSSADVRRGGRLCNRSSRTWNRRAKRPPFSLGAKPLATFVRVISPANTDGDTHGIRLAFARAMGNTGSVVFIEGNMPMQTEIVPLIIVTKLKQFDRGRFGAGRVDARHVVRDALLVNVLLRRLWAAASRDDRPPDSRRLRPPPSAAADGTVSPRRRRHKRSPWGVRLMIGLA